MRLFLASSINKTAKLIPEFTKVKNGIVLFVANASDCDIGDKWWIDADREALKEVGFTIKDIDLRNISKENFEIELNNSDIIHFCGGSVLYLISLLRQKGFDNALIDAVRNNKIIYSGTSAGSMITAADLSLSAFDPEEPEDYKKEQNYLGLGLVNFLIIPHCNSKDFTGSNQKMVKEVPNFSQPLIFIYDNQAVFVQDDNFKIIS